MGKRIDYDQAQQLASTTVNDSIYALPNKYGYKLNVNHPQIFPLYEKYKRKIGEKILSDNQRRTFELLIFQAIKCGKIEIKETKQCTSSQQQSTSS